MSLGMRVAKLKGGGRKTVLVDVLKETCATIEMQRILKITEFKLKCLKIKT